MAASIPLRAAGSLFPSALFSSTVTAKPANLAGNSGCMRWLMYMRRPVVCSIASETEATSTWRKPSRRAPASSPATPLEGACAPTSERNVSESAAASISAAPTLADLVRVDLCIQSSWLYICARTLPSLHSRCKSWCCLLSKSAKGDEYHHAKQKEIHFHISDSGGICCFYHMGATKTCDHRGRVKRPSLQRWHRRGEHSLHCGNRGHRRKQPAQGGRNRAGDAGGSGEYSKGGKASRFRTGRHCLGYGVPGGYQRFPRNEQSLQDGDARPE